MARASPIAAIREIAPGWPVGTPLDPPCILHFENLGCLPLPRAWGKFGQARGRLHVNEAFLVGGFDIPAWNPLAARA